MPKSQFVLRHGYSRELDLFPHIKEFGLKKNNTIQLNSFAVSQSEHFQVYFVIEGKFEWCIDQQHHVVYPGETAVILPGQNMGASNGHLGIGMFIWLQIEIEKINSEGMNVGNWSSLSVGECRTLGKILFLNELPVLKVKEAASILQEMYCELMSQEIGYMARINGMIDSLFIVLARQSTRQSSSRRDFPQTFMKLEQALRRNLAHQWTVEEMAAMVGLGTTAFSEKVKSYTAFSPLQYLINIRIAEAMKLLKKKEVNITDIALETGFYSSQHLSTTFKKLTGHTPSEFRKKNTSNT